MNPEVTADWLTWAFWARDPESLRNLGLIVFGAVGLFLLAWRNWNVHRQAGAALDQSRAALDQSRAALQQADTAEQRHEAQVKADRERRITDSFTRAVEQLGDKDNLTARLGAIYALEDIARDSQRHHWPIMETLTAFVRERAPRGPGAGIGRPATDVQAVLTIIGRRRREHDPDGQRLNLRHTDLRRAELVATNLENADLSEAHLNSANLRQAHLENTVLWGTHLKGAVLAEAHLESALLLSAHLEGAILRDAYASGAKIEGAFLQGAILRGADLRGATLDGSDLTQADLKGADLRGAHYIPEQLADARTDETTQVSPSEEQGRPVSSPSDPASRSG